MNLSGIVVTVSPPRFEEAVAALNTFHNLEIYQRDALTGQIVVVLEAENVDKEISGLKKIKALPMVAYAEMVYHYVADDKQTVAFPDQESTPSHFGEILKKLNN